MMKKRKSKIPPMYPFQQIGVFRGTRKFNGRVLLADDVGLGKTCQSLHMADYFYDGESPIIVVCPASVKYQWKYEVHKHTGWNSWILEGETPATRIPLHVPPVIILNWDILQYWVDFLKQLNPQIVIGDEIHAIKSHTTYRTAAFRLLCKDVPYIFGLSGTPIENGPIEFYNILNILRKDVFPAYRPFAMKYTVPHITHWGIKYSGSANEEELHDLLLDSCMIRRLKSEVLKDLPPIQRTLVPMNIKRKEYDEAEANFLKWLFKKNPGKAIKIKNAVHLAKMTYLLGLVAKKKLPSTTEWIKEFLENNNKKLVVFGHHRSFLEELKSKFDDQSVLVYGGISGKKRQAAIDQFAGDKRCNIFFGSILATGTGINKLQTVCSDLAVAEYIWNGKKILQGEGRLHRLGQFNPVTAYYLFARNTVESIVCRSIQKKEKSFSMVVDGRTEDDEQDFDLFDTVVKSLKKKRLR